MKSNESNNYLGLKLY